MILIDTNVLVYAINEDAAQHSSSRTLVDQAIDGRLPAVFVPQVLVELYAVITDHRRITKPLTPSIAWGQVDVLRSTLPVLDPSGDAMELLGQLVAIHAAKGGRVFDLFLVAQMRARSIETICTYDTAHFRSIAGVDAATPDELLGRLAGTREQEDEANGTPGSV